MNAPLQESQYSSRVHADLLCVIQHASAPARILRTGTLPTMMAVRRLANSTIRCRIGSSYTVPIGQKFR